MRSGRLGIHEGMDTEVYEVQQASGRPNIALERILLILELLRRCIDRRPLIKREVINLGYLSVVDAPCASEICHLDDHPLPNQYVLRLKVTVEDSLDVHDDKRLHDLLEDP